MRDRPDREKRFDPVIVARPQPDEPDEEFVDRLYGAIMGEEAGGDARRQSLHLTRQQPQEPLQLPPEIRRRDSSQSEDRP